MAKWIPQARGPLTHCCPPSCIRCVFATAPLSRDECQVWQIASLSTLSSLIGPPSRSTAMCITGVNGWKLLTPAKLWCGALDQQAKMYRFWDVRANLSHRRTNEVSASFTVNHCVIRCSYCFCKQFKGSPCKIERRLVVTKCTADDDSQFDSNPCLIFHLISFYTSCDVTVKSHNSKQSHGTGLLYKHGAVMVKKITLWFKHLMHFIIAN